MKILVTGSSGTIGTRLCEALLEKEHKVAGADWKPNRWNSDIDKLTVNIDLRDADKLKAESYKLQADMVIHLAANARVYDLVLHPDRAMDNFQTTFNVLEFARVHGIRKCIFASSRETYGNISVGNGTYTEDKAHFMHCESPYTASKIGGEALVEAYKRCYGIDAVIFRFSNVYGAYDDSERVVPLFFHRAKAGEPLAVFGKKKCLDFTYIDDCVDGIILAVEKFDQAKNDTYNIAYGEGVTILHLAERVKELLGSSSAIDVRESRTGEITRFVADIGKARTKLGFTPKVPFEEGIKRAVEWYDRHC